MKLDHLFTLTDHIAVLQHAKFAVPARREGYTVDDNARALVLAAKAQSIWPSEKLLELQRKLLAFILLMQSENGKLHNLMDYSQRILDEPFTGDHLGRVIWATGTVINSSLPAGMKGSARLIFDPRTALGQGICISTNQSLRLPRSRRAITQPAK